MRRQRTSGVLAVLGASLVVVLGATAAAAQAPEKEVVPISVTFLDEGLSEACGVEVTATLTGTRTFFTFPDRPVGPQDMVTVSVTVVLTAADNQIQFRDVGIDLVRVEPDGTVVLMVVGRVPF